MFLLQLPLIHTILWRSPVIFINYEERDDKHPSNRLHYWLLFTAVAERLNESHFIISP